MSVFDKFTLGVWCPHICLLLTTFSLIATTDLKTPSPVAENDKKKMGENSATQLSVIFSAVLLVVVAFLQQ